MKFLFAALAALVIFTPALSQGPEFTVRTSLKRFEPRIEAQAAIKTFEGVLGTKLRAGFYASGGSTIGPDGRPTGAFALLLQTPPGLLAHGVRLDIGAEGRFERDKDNTSRFTTYFEPAAQIVIGGSATSAFALTLPVGRAGGIGLLLTQRL